jgi:formylglycine-generating enzyme required for sulfatase activity
MGALSEAEKRFRNETERHVTLTRPFYIGVTEVTQKQYRELMGSLPDVQSESGDDLPVEHVLWSEAVEYCRKLSDKEGRNYRLPTEAEWEFACRAGTTGAFGGTGVLVDMGWFRENSESRLHPVAQKAPNHWGLYDMHGSVRELCADGYGPYWIGSEVDPVGPPIPTGEVVVRGGNILDEAGECRSASRLAAGPRDRKIRIGFRVVMEAGELPE